MLVRIATAVVALVLLAGCGGASSESAGSAYVSGAGVVKVVPPEDRRAAPDIEGPLLDGGEFDFADHRGQVVVFNVWGSWCPPCRAEAPALQQVWTETREKGVQFVGINTRDQPAAARAFEKRFGITYPSLEDPDGVLLLAFRETLPPNAIPSTIVIDRDGRVAARIVGGTTYSKLRDLVNRFL